MKRLTLPLIAVGILAACGGGDDTAQTTATPGSAPAADTPATQPAAPAASSSAPATEAAPASVPANVPEALKFAAPLVGGGDIELTTLAGRPVLLWFWAPW